jgi:hypothetical protein
MMPLAHPGVCVLTQNLFIIRLDLTFFLLMRWRHCRCTTIASDFVRLSLCALIYFLSFLLSQ